jgi:hypothetical protein
MYFGREKMKVIVAMSMVMMMIVMHDDDSVMHMYDDLYYYCIGVLYAKDSSGGELLSYQVYAILFCIGKQVMMMR